MALLGLPGLPVPIAETLEGNWGDAGPSSFAGMEQSSGTSVSWVSLVFLQLLLL